MIPGRALSLAVAAALIAIDAEAASGLAIRAPSTWIVLAALAGLGLALAWRWGGALLGWTASGAACAAGVLIARADAIPAGTGLIAASGGASAPADGALGAICLAGGAIVGYLVCRRRRPWLAVVMLASAYLVRADVDIAYAHLLPLYVGLCLILVVLAAAHGWRDLRHALPAVPLAGLVLLVAWTVPTPVPLWSHNYQDPIAMLVGDRYAANQAATLSLSGSFHPTDRVLMTIKTNSPDARPYWRVGVFSQYDGHSWQTGPIAPRPVRAAGSLSSVLAPGDGIVTADVTTAVATQALVFPGTPLTTDIASEAVYPDGSPQPSSVASTSVLPTGSTYRVTGIVSPINDAAANGNISESLDPYLQLPAEPPRVRSLALRLVAGVFSPTAEADRLVGYLRDSGKFRYDTTAGSPPNRDAVDDFLFNARRGYCNQFASALAILAREINLPSRLVSGYATGQQRHGQYIVRQRDAHSWVELYIAGEGWVTFDPTPGFDLGAGETTDVGHGATIAGRRPGYSPVVPLRNHPRGAKHAGSTYRVTPRHATVPTRVPHRTYPWLPLAIAVAFLVAVVSALFALRPRTPEQMYAALAGGGNRAGMRVKPSETPLEFAERFRSRGVEYDAMRIIVDLYVRRRYAGAEPSQQELGAMREAWRVLRARRPAYSIVARR